MRDSLHILDVLQRRAYEPQMDARPGACSFDHGTEDSMVRVVVEDGEVRIYRFDRYMVLEWEVHFSDNTPASVIFAALTEAERQAHGPESESCEACEFCGAAIEQDDTDLWHACGVSGADAARHCEEAPDHLHSPDI